MVKTTKKARLCTLVERDRSKNCGKYTRVRCEKTIATKSTFFTYVKLVRSLCPSQKIFNTIANGIFLFGYSTLNYKIIFIYTRRIHFVHLLSSEKRIVFAIFSAVCRCTRRIIVERTRRKKRV